MATLTELEARQAEIRTRLEEIDRDNAGEAFPEEVRSEWNDLNGELDANEVLIAELHARRERLEALSGSERHAEPERVTRRASARGSRVPDNVFDVAEYRSLTRSDDEYRQALRDGAMRAVEGASFPHPDARPDEQRERIEHLLDTKDSDGTFARRVLETSSPAYMRGFAKHLAGRPLSSEEQRALGIGSQGGNYPVPVVLDPTVILTSNGQVNPLRQISRVETITGNTWYGVASSGISASYGAEATEASDNSPTLTQPSANVEKAQAFVPFSVEVGEDWSALQSEMARLLQDAKDSLEATKFLSGAGHGSNEPQGLLVGGTTVVTSAGTATFAVADLYSLVENLPERWQPNASIVAHRHQLNKVRQFDTAGGASLWVQLGNGYPSRLLDYPTSTYSAMSSAGTTGASIMTIGDFSQSLIVDRIGMEVELIPHLFGTANNRPTGQRGLYAYWRNTSLVTAVGAFRTLKLL
jgi:HK97 family phage major capsid protein